MTRPQQRYVAIETLISMVINTAISWGVFTLLFGGQARIALRGLNGALIDFVPQTFMVALMSLLVPTLLTRRRVGLSKVDAIPAAPVPLPGHIAVRALVVALLATLVLGGIASALLLGLNGGTIAYSSLLAAKCLFGAVVALLVTPIAVTAALADRRTTPRIGA